MLLTPPCLYPFVSSWQLLFIYLAVVGLHGFSLVVTSRGYSLAGLLIAEASLIAERGL